MSQAKSNDADAFDDLLGQLVDELAMTRRATPEPEPDQAALLGIARPAPPVNLAPHTGDPSVSHESAELPSSYVPVAEPPRSSMGKYLAIGGSLAIAFMVVGIYAVNKMTEPPPMANSQRTAPGVAVPPPSATVPAPGSAAVAGVPLPGTVPTVGDPTSSGALPAAGMPTTAAPGAAVVPVPATPVDEKPAVKKKPKRPKKPSGGKKPSKDSFDDL